MGSSLDRVLCPFCGGNGIDITLMEDRRRHFLCARDPKHEWMEGDEPPQEEPEGMELSEVAEAIAERVVQKIERPSLGQRILTLFGK